MSVDKSPESAALPVVVVVVVFHLDEQADLFYSAGIHRNRCWLEPTLGRVFGKNVGEWPGRVEIRSCK